MKSFNGFFSSMTEQEEIEQSIIEAAIEKTGRPEVKRALRHKEEKARELQEKLIHGTWYPPRHEKSKLCEGSHKKTRIIVKPRWDDEQIVHHVLMRQFRKIVEPRLYRYACGSLKGRGPHFAKRTIKRWRDEYKGKRFYVAELDIKGFYDNVDTEILKAMLRKKIRDKQYLTVLFHVIDGGAPGLPKGFYTSPWLAHFLLTPFDNYITQTLRPEPEPSAPVESQQPDPSPEPDKSDNGGGLLAVVGLVLLAGGGAAYFVMFKKKKGCIKTICPIVGNI